jgi:hypothetical protein
MKETRAFLIRGRLKKERNFLAASGNVQKREPGPEETRPSFIIALMEYVCPLLIPLNKQRSACSCPLESGTFIAAVCGCEVLVAHKTDMVHALEQLFCQFRKAG